MQSAVQSGNPHQLTIHGHVFPRASIARFASVDGNVELRLSGESRVRRKHPRNSIFCAERAWDQRAETGYMKDIEDQFQKVADEVIGGRSSLAPSQDLIAAKFFVLWSRRIESKHRPLSDQPVKRVRGEPLTKDQQEVLEKGTVAYVQGDQTMPGRVLAGLKIQMEIDSVCVQFAGVHWGIVKAQQGEFICPDTFGRLAVIPLNPMLFLYANHSDMVVPIEEVALRNRVAQQCARDYCFAREFASCPI
jgi:hypothetical protein